MALTQVDQGLLGTYAQYTGFKNRIINGAMVIDQRNAGASVTPTNNQYTLDRFTFFVSQASKLTVQQNAGSVTPPSGFLNYLGVTSSSAYSITSGDYFSLVQSIEGFNTSDFALGTASAVNFTLSFWVRSSLTGTFGGAVRNSAANRSYPFSYTISSANTWEQKSITIAGDTSGTWIGATNGTGLTVIWGLGVGSTYSGTAGAWAGSNFNSATGATSVVGTNGATFYITGVQLEKGSTATSFDYRPYGTELALCQRYFQVCGFVGTAVATNELGIASQFKVTMRGTPSMSTVLYNTDTISGSANTLLRVGIGNTSVGSASYTATSAGNNISNLITTGLTSGGVYVGAFQASAEL
jgi:hypothetical protein